MSNPVDIGDLADAWFDFSEHTSTLYVAFTGHKAVTRRGDDISVRNIGILPDVDYTISISGVLFKLVFKAHVRGCLVFQAVASVPGDSLSPFGPDNLLLLSGPSRGVVKLDS